MTVRATVRMPGPGQDGPADAPLTRLVADGGHDGVGLVIVRLRTCGGPARRGYALSASCA
jgi:hypothetical protein